jgi:hypothetical protein
VIVDDQHSGHEHIVACPPSGISLNPMRVQGCP